MMENLRTGKISTLMNEMARLRPVTGPIMFMTTARSRPMASMKKRGPGPRSSSS